MISSTPGRNRPVPDRPGARHLDLTVGQPSTETQLVAVLGAGGHGRELADIVMDISAVDPSIELLGIADDNDPDRLALARCGFRFLGDRTALESRNVELHLGVGYPEVRARLDGLLQRAAKPLVHPSAHLGSGCMLDDGVVLAQQAIVTTNVVLGRHTHINVSASVSHDCVLGRYVTVCPGVTVTGNVTIADGVFIGAGATILPGISIGAGAVVGTGAVVATDVEANATVAGVPARPLRP